MHGPVFIIVLKNVFSEDFTLLAVSSVSSFEFYSIGVIITHTHTHHICSLTWLFFFFFFFFLKWPNIYYLTWKWVWVMDATATATATVTAMPDPRPWQRHTVVSTLRLWTQLWLWFHFCQSLNSLVWRNARLWSQDSCLRLKTQFAECTDSFSGSTALLTWLNYKSLLTYSCISLVLYMMLQVFPQKEEKKAMYSVSPALTVNVRLSDSNCKQNFFSAGVPLVTTLSQNNLPLWLILFIIIKGLKLWFVCFYPFYFINRCGLPGGHHNNVLFSPLISPLGF